MKKVKLDLSTPRRFCFIGAGDALKAFLQIFVDATSEPAPILVISDQDVDARWSDDNDPSIGELCDALRLELILIDSKQESSILDAIQSHRSNIGSVFGWPHLISEKTLAHFQGCIFNFHPTDLPRFRGPGGGFSWQILQRETDVCVSIHQMVPTFDAGSILLQEKAPIDPTRINPETYRSGLKKLYREIVFPKLAEIFLHADSVELDPQESASAQYFPKLDSTKNGLIDFSWDIDAIEVFVRAFGSPFQGANALYNETPYFIERSEIHRRISNVHPFCFGLIVDVADRHVSVLCNGGQLNFLGLRDSERVDVSTREFRVGNRMYNTPDALLQAKLFRPI